MRLVAAQQKVIQIEVIDRLPITLYLDITQRSRRQRSARCKQRIQQRAQRAHREAAWPPRLSHHKHLHRAQRTHRHAQREVAADPSHLGLFRYPGNSPYVSSRASNVHAAQLRDLNRPIAVHRQRHLPVHLSGQLQHDLIARPQHIARSHRHILHRRKRRRHAPEQRRSIDLELFPVVACTICWNGLGGSGGSSGCNWLACSCCFLGLAQRLRPCSCGLRVRARLPGSNCDSEFVVVIFPGEGSVAVDGIWLVG